MTCKVVKSPNKYSGTIHIPSTVTFKSKELSVVAIGVEAFKSCSELYSVELSEGITDIYVSSFSDCTALKDISLPNSLTGIGSNAFEYCTSLQSIIIPNSVSHMGKEVFMGCKNLSEIKLSNCLFQLTEGLFKDCSALKEISVPKSVKIGKNCFENCISLSTIDFPLTYIGDSAFKGCISLKSVQIPGVYKIEENAFSNCTALEEFGFRADINTFTTPLGDHDKIKTIFNNCPKLTKLIVYPALTVYDHEYDEIIKCYHEWLNEINITELDLRAKYLSNSYDESTPSSNRNYFYNLSIASLASISLDNKAIMSIRSDQGIFDHYYWHIGFESNKGLKCIICNGEPPVLGYGSANFTNDQYMNTSVYVPEELLDLYQNTKPWNVFWNLKPMSEYDSIIPIMGNDILNRTEISRYNINGEVVDESYRGFVIILFSDGTSKKVIQ